MDIIEAIYKRHSVRQYVDRPIEDSVAETLRTEIEKCNAESGAHFQLIQNEPKAMSCLTAKYGKFKNANNYIAVVAPKKGFDEEIGYYGEKIVLLATQLGLGTCWVAGTYRKTPNVIEFSGGEKLHMIIAIGYGENEGKARKSKTPEAVSNISQDSPEWFKKGVECALLAPTALNLQRFRFDLTDDGIKATALSAAFSETSLGIAKLHFELGAGEENFKFCQSIAI